MQILKVDTNATPQYNNIPSSQRQHNDASIYAASQPKTFGTSGGLRTSEELNNTSPRNDGSTSRLTVGNETSPTKMVEARNTEMINESGPEGGPTSENLVPKANGVDPIISGGVPVDEQAQETGSSRS